MSYNIIDTGAARLREPLVHQGRRITSVGYGLLKNQIVDVIRGETWLQDLNTILPDLCIISSPAIL